MDEVKQGARVSSRRRNSQAGLSLIDALVALIAVTIGMLALAQVQTRFRFNADLSRQRAEAVRIAQADMENWRAFSVLDAPSCPHPSGRVAYACIASQSRTLYTGQTNANADFYLTRTVDSSLPSYKALQLRVDWEDRNGTNQQITVDSVIARTDPTLASQMAIPPSVSGVRNPLNRNVRIPSVAIALGNGRSGMTPPGAAGAGTFFVFSNSDASVIQRCNAAVANVADYDTAVAGGLCTDLSGFLVSGFVNFDLRRRVSAISPGSTSCNFYSDAQDGNLIAPPSSPTLNVSRFEIVNRAQGSSVEMGLTPGFFINLVSVVETSSLNGQPNVSVSNPLQIALQTDAINANNSYFSTTSSQIVLRVRSGATVETFTPVSAGNITDQRRLRRSGDNSLVDALSGTTLSIDPTANLAANTVYELVIPANLITLRRNSNTDAVQPAIVITFSTGSGPVLASTNPANGAATLTLADNMSLTFDRNVVGGRGIVTLLRRGNGNNYSAVETFNVATGVGGSGGSISFSGATVTLNPNADLVASGEYAIQVEAGAIRDTNGINYAGISNNTTYAFTALGSVAGGGDCSNPVSFMNAGLSNLTNSLPGGALTSECYSDDVAAAASSAATVGYFCAVYTTNRLAGQAVAWSGNARLLGPSGWLTGGQSRYRVCRYHDGNGDNVDTNPEHPDPYSDVSESLTDQNFLVVANSESCPSETLNIGSQTGVVVHFKTAQIQP